MPAEVKGLVVPSPAPPLSQQDERPMVSVLMGYLDELLAHRPLAKCLGALVLAACRPLLRGELCQPAGSRATPRLCSPHLLQVLTPTATHLQCMKPCKDLSSADRCFPAISPHVPCPLGC